MIENQTILVQLLVAILISSVSGLLGVYLQKLWASRKPKINIQSVGFHGGTIKIDDTTASMSKESSWGENIEGYVSFENLLDYELKMGETSARLEQAREEASDWLKKHAEFKNGLTLTFSALEKCPYLYNPAIHSFVYGNLRRRKSINLPTKFDSVEKLDNIYSIARETDEEIVVHRGSHATRFPIDKDFRDQEKLVNKNIAYSFLKGESKNIFYLVESFVTSISEDILKLKSLQEELRKTITSYASINFTVAISNIGTEPHLYMPRAYVELAYGDDKKQVLVHHQLSEKNESTELAQLLAKESKNKNMNKRVQVDSFLDKTDLSPHILIGGNSTVYVSFFASEALGNSAEQIINFYRIGGLKARLALWSSTASLHTSNLTVFSKNISEENQEKMRIATNKALQRTSR
ncbi:hypothetical protein [Shewanella waksmanii]|uniref:hypothetical protein n=1 Tax=Shewanella waksmanii TaxID=213783 RepID=UPI00048D523C|nr:hypothetical protein [Shewanella waksmanii]